MTLSPAAYDTIKAHFADTGRSASDYDAIVTGDLGVVGHDILLDLFKKDGLDLTALYMDCGMLIYDLDEQDVHAGGSGCGCAASVFSSYFLPGMMSNRWQNLLFCATGALLSPTSALQGESIPGICHAIELTVKGA